ncbi:SET domain protein, putative [Plasmodium vivax]|uniref:SET domain protein, putative n=1 Tax=Plasmodium vivax TaxID=5855 RepID=A0A1G4GTB1_PLAVI|nr:SET domain protein, putative [Plasmodium vivax]
MKEKNGRRNNLGGGGQMEGSQSGSGGGTSGGVPISGGNNRTGSAFSGGSDNAVDNRYGNDFPPSYNNTFENGFGEGCGDGFGDGFAPRLDKSCDVGCSPVGDSMDASKRVEVGGQVNVSKNKGLNNLNSAEEVYYVEGSEHVVNDLDEEKKGPEGRRPSGQGGAVGGEEEEPELCNEVVDSDKCAEESNRQNCEAPVGEFYTASQVPDGNLGQLSIQSFKGVVASGVGLTANTVGLAANTVGLTANTVGLAANSVGLSANCIGASPEEPPQFRVQSAEVVKLKKRGKPKFIKRETNLKSGKHEEKEDVVVSLGNPPSLFNPVGTIGMSKVGRKKGRREKSAIGAKMENEGAFRFAPVGCNVKEYMANSGGNSVANSGANGCHSGSGVNGAAPFEKSLANKAGERRKRKLRKGKIKTKKKIPRKKRSKCTLKGNTASGRFKYETTHAGNGKLKNEKKNYLKDELCCNHNEDANGACGSGVVHDISNKFSNIKISKHFFLKMDDDDEEEEDYDEVEEDARSSRHSSMSLSLAKKNFQKKIIILDERANGGGRGAIGYAGVGGTGGKGAGCSGAGGPLASGQDPANEVSGGIGKDGKNGIEGNDGNVFNDDGRPPGGDHKVMKRVLTSEESATLLNNVKDINMKRFNFSGIISSKDSLMEQFMLYNLFSYDITILKGSLKFIYTFCLFKNLRLYYQIQDKNVYIDEKAISNCRIKDNLIDTHSIILTMYDSYCKHLNRNKIPIDDFINLNYFNIHNVKFAKKNVQHNKSYDDSILPEKDNRKISSMYKCRPYLYSNYSNDEKDSPGKRVTVEVQKKGVAKAEGVGNTPIVKGSESKRGRAARGSVKGEVVPSQELSTVKEDSSKECPQLCKDPAPVTCKVEDAPCELAQESQVEGKREEEQQGGAEVEEVEEEEVDVVEEAAVEVAGVDEAGVGAAGGDAPGVETWEDPLPAQKGRKRKMLVGGAKEGGAPDCASKKQRGREADAGEGANGSEDTQGGKAASQADGEAHQVGSESTHAVLPLCQVKKETPDMLECVEKSKCEEAVTGLTRVKDEEKEEKAMEGGKGYNCMGIVPPDEGAEAGRVVVKSERWEKDEPVTPDGRRKHLLQKYNEAITKGSITATGESKKKLMLRGRNMKEEKAIKKSKLGRPCKQSGSSNVPIKRGRKKFFCNNNLSLMKNRRRRRGRISSKKTKRKTEERSTRGGDSHFKKRNSDHGEYTEYGEDVSELENVNVMLLERIKNNYKMIMENDKLNRKKREEKMMLMSGGGGATSAATSGGAFGRADNFAGHEGGLPEGSTNGSGIGGNGESGESGPGRLSGPGRPGGGSGPGRPSGGSGPGRPSGGSGLGRPNGPGRPSGYASTLGNNPSGSHHAGGSKEEKVSGGKLDATGIYQSSNNELSEREKKYMLSVDWLYNNNFNILDIKVNTHFSHNYHISLFFLCKYTSYNLFLHPINKNEHIVSSVILNSKNEVLTDNGNFFVLRYLLSFLSNKISSLRKCYANALYNSYLLQMPIRIFRHNNLKTKYSPNYGIRYDGIYKIVNAFTSNDFSTSEYKRDILYVFKRLYVDKCFIPRNCRFYENQCERKKYLIEKNSVSINVFLDGEMIMTLTVPYLKNYKSTTFMNFNHIYKFIRRKCIKEKLATQWVRSDVRMYEECKRKLRQEEALRRAASLEGGQPEGEIGHKPGEAACKVDAPHGSAPKGNAPNGGGGAETFPFWCRGKYLPLVLVLKTLNFEKEINENQRIRTKNFKNIEISVRKTEIPINCEMAKRPAHLFIPIKSKEAIAAHIELKRPFEDTWNPYEDLSAGKEKFKIPVENSVDDSLPPMNFTYVSKTLFFSRLPPYNLLPLCSGCAPQNYSKKEFDEIYINGYCKALRHKRTSRIYCDGNKSYDINDFNVLAACSGNCLCDPLKCTNKFPEGLHYPVKVVKTRDIGWDIVSSSYIKANSLIMHYVGEITTRKEMISREHEYDKKGYFNYFIETAEVDETYTDDWKIPCIDALFISNVARFLNHSCEPNVNVITIWRGDNYPSVGIFASRDIKPDEPLKYHYGINYKNIKCMCNSKKCKGYIG